MEDLSLIEELTPKINVNANYWFVRTEGGDLYDTFVKNRFIAFGYPKINIENIKNCITHSSPVSELRKAVVKKYPEIEQPGRVAAQLKKFATDIKKGDYVVIPSKSSQRLSIGQVTDGDLYDNLLNNNVESLWDYNKQKKINWMKHVFKSSINPNLLGLFNSHQAINDATHYAGWIDNLLFDYYKKNNKYHLLINIHKHRSIKARSLFRSCLSLLDIADSFCEDNKLEKNSYDIETKINLSSPGIIELIGSISYVMVIVGAIIVGLNGGEFKLQSKKLGVGVKVSTKGLISRINNFLNSKKDRALKTELQKKISELSFEDPNDIVSVLSELNKRNQND